VGCTLGIKNIKDFILVKQLCRVKVIKQEKILVQ